VHNLSVRRLLTKITKVMFAPIHITNWKGTSSELDRLSICDVAFADLVSATAADNALGLARDIVLLSQDQNFPCMPPLQATSD